LNSFLFFFILDDLIYPDPQSTTSAAQEHRIKCLSKGYVKLKKKRKTTEVVKHSRQTLDLIQHIYLEKEHA